MQKMTIAHLATKITRHSWKLSHTASVRGPSQGPYSELAEATSHADALFL
jgi:hypothetical protein